MRALVLFATAGCGEIFGLDAPILYDAPTTLDHPADAPGTRITVAFQGGVDGYADVHDTYIDGGNPGSMHDNDVRLRWRDTRAALIWFDKIFTSTGIPIDGRIESASLRVRVDIANASADVIESAVAWSDGVTYDTFGITPGIDDTDLGAVVATVPAAVGTQDIDVTASLQRWAVEPATNHGWVFRANPPTGSESTIKSTDDGTVTERPRLTVTFFGP